MGILSRHGSHRTIKPRTGPVAALDVGTTKVCCFVAGAGEGGRLRIRGIGHHRSEGIRNGAVVDLQAAEASIRAAVDAAEQMAGEVIEHVVVNVTGGRPRSDNAAVEVAVDGHQVGEGDMRRIQDCLHRNAFEEDRELIHNIPLSYIIDGVNGIKDPRGMHGQRLGVSIHQVSVRTNALRNLATVIRRCHLEVEDWVAAPYAAALGCLVEDAMELGVTCIDMGGGSTSLAVFQGGAFVHMGVIPVGGRHITGDIAQGLSTPLNDAERLKTLYGNALYAVSDNKETLLIRHVGEEEEEARTTVPRSMLNQIIQPRVEEILELVRAHLEAAGLLKSAGRLVVLTGGASQLHGVGEAAGIILGKKVRVAPPHEIKGLAEATGKPNFSTAVGLLRHGAQLRASGALQRMEEEQSMSGSWGRLGRWLHQNF